MSNTTPSSKPGIKTSEFWVGTLTAPLVAIIAGLLSMVGIQVGDATIATLVSPAIVYIFGRGWIKKESAKSGS